MIKYGQIIVIGVAAAIISLLFGGCSTIGRVGSAAAGLFAPEYKATADNLYALLLDDQLAASLNVEVVLEDAEGRTYRKADLHPVVLTSRRSYTWDQLPRGAWERFLGEEKGRDAVDGHKQALANALAAIPSAPANKDKEKK